MAKKQRPISGLFDMGVWSRKLLQDNLFYILFIGLLTLAYIANAHLAERNVREIQTLQKELKEMRWYYMSLQSENMYNAKRSEVAKRVKDNGLRPHRKQLNRIRVRKEAYQLGDGY